MWCALLYLLLFLSHSRAQESFTSDNSDCVCSDWYGRCKKEGEAWIDDGVWSYECKGGDTVFVGCELSSDRKLNVNENVTIDGTWYACEADERRLRYESEVTCDVNGTKIRVGEEWKEGSFRWLCLDTGRWVTGCYYKNETQDDVLLKIGESALNGLIKHVCDRFEDNPGRVQYYTQVRDDAHVKHPTNKGESNNFPDPIISRIEGKVHRWLHEEAEYFISNDSFRARIRYLPASRRPLTNTVQ